MARRVRARDGGVRLGLKVSNERIPSQADLDLRLVRYFTAVAEFGHFGRAAAALRIAQPSLSRQIQRLEAQIGTRLLDRTTHGARLTKAGQAFLPRAKALLHSADQAGAAARNAARTAQITIGHTPGLDITPAVRELRRRQPEADVVTVHLLWNQAREALFERRVDAAVSRLPFRTDGLQVTVLYDEPCVLLVPRSHRLVGRDYVTPEDIAEETLPHWPDPAAKPLGRTGPRPDGSPGPETPLVTTVEEKLELITAGQMVAIVAEAVAAEVPAHLTTIPLRGVEPHKVMMVNRDGEHSPLVEAFREAAQAALPQPD
ncbi:LysR family transcriptional regulator [Sphaerisporangium sp. TRM90804]|uniref:LysR substrate-binding domain-containing protein n=1 Tax=Sphaerisporangium sp. TRM90804 TaxID=3031113 RepID=UPI00244B2FAB|nr:LysR family transcriptional regulator [Sphaerisporangium sp. TRM90804]MDH2426693.1 LysR family transcriptional regulator [Sphaerisporangium sp. TRM90804]